MKELKKICFRENGIEKCLDQRGHPPTVASYIKESLQKAINEGKEFVNPSEIIYKAEEKAQKEGKLNPFIKQVEEIIELKKVIEELNK